MKILKFGGSSVANPERIKSVSKIVGEAAANEPVVVVVSAFQGVTNQLLEAARMAERGDLGYLRQLELLALRHLDAGRTLLSWSKATPARESVEKLLNEFRDSLNGIYLLRHAPPRALDLVGSFGERLSMVIIGAFFENTIGASSVDSRELIVTDDQFTRASVNFELTNARISAFFASRKGKSRKITVTTGFIGSTEDGRTTTIGRNGSDYTASIFGAALDASVVEIWTDVDGILSADPASVSSAFVLPQMTYEEAMELSYFGAKVLHAATLAPAVAKNIPILIKNTLNPSAAGTRISRSAERWESAAKGITSVDDMTLFTLRGMSMVGVPGTAERLFRTLAAGSVNVILISQASSEHTICFAVATTDAAKAKKAVANEFRYELTAKVTALEEKPSQTIVAIVGEGMKGTPGVAGKVFNSLGVNNINISAIAQGASERNISFVIDAEQKTRALNVIHQAFFEKRKHISLAVLGIGKIGTTFLSQLHQQREALRRSGYEVSVCAISDSKRTIVAAGGLDLSNWQQRLEAGGKHLSLPELAKKVSSFQLTNVALVDCTASSDVVEAYNLFVDANMHIITPNKKANVLPWAEYAGLIDRLSLRQKHFLYEANVGAGLPIISTLQDLISSGDAVQRIEGVLSGTLSYLFNMYDDSVPFSKLVKEAQVLGYTEPDPREDLGGQDVARKLLILARQLGYKMELADIMVESLVPAALSKGTFSEPWYAKFAKYDGDISAIYKKAHAKGNVLRFAGVLENGKAKAGLSEFPESHPFAKITGSDNIVVFSTARYSSSPLVVQGPGAGADVTAMGVFSDLLKLLHYLPY